MGIFDKIESVTSTSKGKSFSHEENELIRSAVTELLLRCEGNQSELARLLGVAQSTISNFRTGKTGAGVQLAQAVARERGVTMEQLLSPGAPVTPTRWSALPWWKDAIAQARKLFPKVSELAWSRLGALSGERPPTRDPVGLGMLASTWDQVSTDDDRAAEIAAQASAEMAAEDEKMDDLLKRRHVARETGAKVPRLPEEPLKKGRR